MKIIRRHQNERLDPYVFDLAYIIMVAMYEKRKSVCYK